jgi:hypothetical protein
MVPVPDPGVVLPIPLSDALSLLATHFQPGLFLVKPFDITYVADLSTDAQKSFFVFFCVSRELAGPSGIALMEGPCDAKGTSGCWLRCVWLSRTGRITKDICWIVD